MAEPVVEDWMTIPQPPQSLSTDIGDERFNPLGSHPPPPPPALSSFPSNPDMARSSFALPTIPGWTRNSDGELVRNNSVVSRLESPISRQNSDDTVIAPRRALSVVTEEHPDVARQRRRDERAEAKARRAAPGWNGFDFDVNDSTRAIPPPTSTVPSPALNRYESVQRPGTGLGAQDYFGHEKDTRITVESYIPSPPPTNSIFGKWNIGSVKNLLSLRRRPKPAASQSGASTNGSRWSRWGGAKIADRFQKLTTKASSSKPEKPIPTNDEGPPAPSSRWWSKRPSMFSSRNKPVGEGKSWCKMPKWVTDRSERKASKKETDKEKETDDGGNSRPASSRWYNYRPWSTRKGEGGRPATTQTGTKFSFAKPWASLFSPSAHEPAKKEKTETGAEDTDAPKSAWWSPSRYSRANKRDAASGGKDEKAKSGSFFKRCFGRKRTNESESGSEIETSDSSGKTSGESRRSAGSGRSSLRSRNKAKRPRARAVIIEADRENTERPGGGGRATGNTSAESHNGDKEEPARTQRSFFSLGRSSKRVQGTNAKGANGETQEQTSNKAWYGGVTSTLSKVGKAIFHRGERGDRTISNGAGSGTESTITDPTHNDNDSPPTNQTTNNLDDGDTTDAAANKSAKRSFWTWGSSKGEKTKKSRGTGDEKDSAEGDQSDGWWKKLTSKRNRSSAEGTERLLQKPDKTISNGASSRSKAEGNPKSWSLGSLWPSQWSRGGRKSRSSQSEGVIENHGNDTNPSYLDYLETYRSYYHDKDLSKKDRKRIETETRQALKSSRLSGVTLSDIAKGSKQRWTEADRSVTHDKYETLKTDTEVALALATWDVASDSKGWSQIFSRKRDPTLRAIDLTRKRESKYSSKAKKSSSRATETEGGTEGESA